MRETTQAIWAIDPKRPIIVDGIDIAHSPFKEITDLPVIQSFHSYEPQLGNWEWDKELASAPQWPMLRLGQILYGNQKPEAQGPLEIAIPLKKKSKIQIHVLQVSQKANLYVKANGLEIWNKEFQPGAGEGEWEEVIYRPEWKIYQNRYNKIYEVELPNDTSEIAVGISEGD